MLFFPPLAVTVVRCKDLVAADLQVIALEELMKSSPSPDREDVPLCEERRTWSGRTGFTFDYGSVASGSLAEFV